jgi:hypothetical protein
MSPTARDGRALADGSPAAGELFNQMVSGVEDFRTAEWPERFPPGSAATRDAAAVKGAMQAGRVVLHPLIAQRSASRRGTTSPRPEPGPPWSTS